MLPFNKIIKSNVMDKISNKYIPPLFIGHGGGPLPILGDPGHREMIKSINKLHKYLPKPKEILVISAHWEEDDFTVLENEKPRLLYDYYGFHEEAYNLDYPIYPAKDLNQKIYQLLDDNKIKYKKSSRRDYDHGVFIPLMLLYKNLDIPVAQISINSNMNPKEHIRIGQALSSLSNDGVLILASGMSFHNMRGFFSSPSQANLESANKFNDYLKQIFDKDSDLSKDERMKFIENWDKAEGARYCHPREEHLIPLFVAAGSSYNGKGLIQEYELMNFKIINVIFTNFENEENGNQDL